MYVTVDVDVDLSQFDTEDLIEELECRGADYVRPVIWQGTLIEEIYNARRCGKPYEHLLDAYLYQVTGRAI